MSDFRLEKWYFDCVAFDGTVLIGYAARLRWGFVRLSYGARILSSNGSPTSQRQSLSFGQVGDEVRSLRWKNEKLNVSGEWTRGTPIPKTVVVDGPTGCVEWQCLGADCAVDLTVEGRTMTGIGYAERLTMTIPPWRLPFAQLRWGRYISDDRRDFMVWIDLRGASSRTWVWVNSGEAVTGVVDEGGVRTDLAELSFRTSRTLLSDDVARTLLGRLESFERFLPAGVRAIQEDKQLSNCVLRIAGSESTGFSINEVVTWGRA